MCFMNTIIPAITPIIVIVLGVVFVFMTWSQRTRYFDYQCKNCGAVFNLPFSVAVVSPHMMGRKYVKCPHCGQWSWVSPVPKE